MLNSPEGRGNGHEMKKKDVNVEPLFTDQYPAASALYSSTVV